MDIDSGFGGTFELGHDGDLVLLGFLNCDGVRVFAVEIVPDVAVQLAKALAQHAMKAGHGRPVTFTLGVSP